LRYVLGVDGGQTSTLAVVAGEDGTILGAGRGGPANHLNEPGGPERLRRSLADSIGGALASAGLSGQTLDAVCCGMTGGGELVGQYVPEIAPVKSVRLEHDAFTALVGGTAGASGVVVIAGTGSVVLGMDPTGNRVAVGGWGYVMGDEGSAHDIAIWALRAATSASDGRLPATELVRAIPAHYGVADLRELHGLIYSGRLGRPRLAEIARVVGQLAADGDAASRAILGAAAESLALAAGAAISRLEALERELPVVYVGGVFQAGEQILAPFTQALARRAPKAKVQPPRFPPVVGALILAFQDLGLPLDEGRLARLEATRSVATQAK
jgi:N-acetylglucosamine kinase-like BadF-type ATPase